MPPSGWRRTAPKRPNCRGWAGGKSRRCSCCKGAPDGLPMAVLGERGITSAALTRLKALGLVAIRETSASIAIRSSTRFRRSKPFGHVNATDDQRRALRTAAAARRASRVRRRAPARRDRQRQDRGLSAARRCRPQKWPRRPGAGARDRADAAGRRSVPCPIRRRGGHSAQRVVRRRAPRSMASHPPRRRRRRDRHAIGGLRTARDSPA